MDKDHDNRLGDNDFSQSVREDPVLLSCFGQVFANSRVSLCYNIIHHRTIWIYLEKSRFRTYS